MGKIDDLPGEAWPKGIRFLLIALFLIPVSCAESRREDVISRFEGGEKQVIGVYRGSGTNEQLVERHTYNVRGELVLLENLETGTTSTWQDLHPELNTADGLQAALQGDWYGVFQNTVVTVETKITITGAVTETVIAYDYLDLDEEFDFETSYESTLEFLSERRVRMTSDEDATDDPSFPTPPSTVTSALDFLDAGAYKARQTTLLDGRISIESVYGGALYRDPVRARENAPSAEEMDRISAASDAAWREAIGGDEQLKSEYPEYYAFWVTEEE